MEQIIATGIVAEEKDNMLVVRINEKTARGQITANGNRSVSSGGFRPVVFGGRVWNVSLNLYAAASESEAKELPAKPAKKVKK